MKLTLQKRVAGQLLDAGPSRIWIDPAKLDEAKEAITKVDIRGLIKKGIIRLKPENTTSRGRARKKQEQRSKGRQRGSGSRKGKAGARLSGKKAWMAKIRVQRNFIKELRDKELISKESYHELYGKSKGGFFRSKRHIKLYIDEHKLALNDKK